LGVSRDENTYSDIIASLLKNEYGILFLNALIKECGIILPENLAKEFTVFREYHRIDISIIFEKEKYIIGIENKIDAEEQEKQIKRYQEIFKKYYASYNGLFLFLTPSGRASITADKGSKFRCYPASYTNLLNALFEIRNYEKTSSAVEIFAECIKEELAMDEITQKEIYSYWGKCGNKDILTQLNQNKPEISVVEKKLSQKISEYLKTKGDALDGDPIISYKNQEIQVWTQSIDEKLPICFLFYDREDQGNRPSLRIVIDKDSFNPKNVSQKLVQEYKEKNDQLSFEPIKGWTFWHAVYSGKNKDPEFIMKEDHDYGNKLVTALFGAFKREYEKIKKWI
jgi:hypothetical protein